MRKNKVLLYILIIVAVVVYESCTTGAVYENYLEIQGQSWGINEMAKFDAPIEDTLSNYDVFIHVRNLSKYENRNLWLFVKTTAPNGAFVKDTFEIYLADDRGKWLGKGWGDVYDNKIPYKSNIRFPLQGDYTFELVQAMRVEELKYITDVGISIEKSSLE